MLSVPIKVLDQAQIAEEADRLILDFFLQRPEGEWTLDQYLDDYTGFFPGINERKLADYAVRLIRRYLVTDVISLDASPDAP